jgi:putative ABC transport system permease protein
MIPVKYNIRSLAVRKATTIATALGIALVVFVLAASLMLSAGIKKTFASNARNDVAVVMRKGSDNEMSSALTTEDINKIVGTQATQSSSELVMVLAMEKIGAPGVTNVQVRGVTEAAQKLRPEVKVVEGRLPQAGRDEVMVGKRIHGRFKDVELGHKFELRKNRPVTVVGVFTADGSSNESEIWCDLDVLRAAFGREGGVSSVRVKLDSAGAFDGFKIAMESDKALGFMALRETEYVKKQSEDTAAFIGIIGTLISVFFALGAMIGAMITMYAAVANRQREIGTLRALGFSRRSILLSFLVESVTLSLLGGLVGGTAAMGMKFVKFSMMNFASWSEVVFSFEPTPQVITTALLFAGAMGLFGGFFPAIRAARVSPIQAMRG